MQVLRFLFSPAGWLSPQPFILTAAAVYAAGVASQWLTVPEVIDRAGLWPFVAVQAALIWIWFALHAKRLRDAGRGLGLAAGVALLYTLSVVLLIIVAVAFFSTVQGPDANAAGATGLILFVWIIALLLGSPHYDLSWLMAAILTTLALAPVIVAVVFTIWAATRPSARGAAA
jgi:hypothetical protein